MKLLIAPGRLTGRWCKKTDRLWSQDSHAEAATIMFGRPCAPAKSSNWCRATNSRLAVKLIRLSNSFSHFIVSLLLGLRGSLVAPSHLCEIRVTIGSFGTLIEEIIGGCAYSLLHSVA